MVLMMSAAAAAMSHPHSAEDVILLDEPTPNGHMPPPDSRRHVRGNYHLALCPVCPLSTPQHDRSILSLSTLSCVT
jgi:hypothetical protein